jgi:DNA-binding GntR family transcriptional regulator
VDGPSIEGVSEGSKVDEIAYVLEQAIVSGELAPGTLLRQEQLSEQFDVSRTPIREALRRLAALGLVSIVPNRGARVRTLSREDLREAFLVRAELESLATELAAGRITDEQLDELDRAERRFARASSVLRDHGRPEPERAGLTTDWLIANYAFHDVIYEAAGAPLVARIAKSARRTFLGQSIWVPGGPEIDGLYEKNVQQHRAIVAALRARSASGARALAREHVLDSGRLLEVLLDHVSDQSRERLLGAVPA